MLSKRWVTLIILSSVVNGCNQIGDTFVKEIWNDDKSLQIIKHQVYYKNELFSGVLKDSFPNGQLKYSKAYANGLEHGKISGWHFNGNVSYHYQANHGKREGIYLENYPSGKRQIQATYIDGEIVANKVIDINGKILVNSKSRNGRIYGLLGSSECRSVYNKKEAEFIKNNN